MLGGKPETRRTEGLRTSGRSAVVVARVLDATARELGRSGYAALRVEDVAALSGVNKTTIYRRWPTKSDLVRATLGLFARAQHEADTGSLREDLLAHFGHVTTSLRSPVGRGLVRTLQLERADPELERVLREHRDAQQRVRLAMFERARERGELPRGADVALLAELVAAPIVARIKHSELRVERGFVESVIDVVLAGAAATVKKHKPRKR